MLKDKIEKKSIKKEKKIRVNSDQPTKTLTDSQLTQILKDKIEKQIDKKRLKNPNSSLLC